MNCIISTRGAVHVIGVMFQAASRRGCNPPQGDVMHACLCRIITEVGPGVQRLKVGDRVALEPGVPCWSNKACREGRYNLCPDIKFFATPPHHGSLMQVGLSSYVGDTWEHGLKSRAYYSQMTSDDSQRIQCLCPRNKFQDTEYSFPLSNQSSVFICTCMRHA